MTDRDDNKPSDSHHSDERRPFDIAGHHVTPGSNADIALPISKFSSGTPVTLDLRILHGKCPGPVIFVSGAIHGDEIIGTEIIRRVLPKLNPKRLSGTIIFAPVVNVFGFIAHDRYLPDRRDLNRSFPGFAKGSLASQIAYIFRTEVMARCTLGIDIHSAAQHRYNLPQIRIEPDNPALQDLALEFGAPAIIESPLRPGSMRAVAKDNGVDMLLLEAGEALRVDEISVRVGVSGILHVLKHLGMISNKRLGRVQPHPARSSRSTWLRAPRGGIYRPAKISGSRVLTGDIVAIVSDAMGDDPHTITAPIDGIIIGHRQLPIVNQGDALLHIAEVRSIDTVEERIGTITGSILDDVMLDDVMLDEDEVL